MLSEETGATGGDSGISIEGTYTQTVCHGLFGFWKCLNFEYVKLIFIHWIIKGTLVVNVRSYFQFY